MIMRMRVYREMYSLNNLTYVLLNNTLNSIPDFIVRGVNAHAHE